MNSRLSSLKVKIFADGAEIADIERYSDNPIIKGVTTNPTLMRKAGITDYKAFALEVLAVVPEKPVSFEVFADDISTMEEQAMEIASWGQNVFVKVPVTNTKGESTAKLCGRLSENGVQLNVTALFTLEQVRRVAAELSYDTAAVISVFAGRIADTGLDPMPIMRQCKTALAGHPKAELLWASPREVLNIFQADETDCDIITVAHDLLAKLTAIGKDLDAFSLETVQMFYSDATAANYKIATG